MIGYSYSHSVLICFTGGFQIPTPGTPPQEPKGRAAPMFSRGISGGSSRVDEVPAGFTPGNDIFPPGNIIDLRVTASSFENKTVTLMWTAPGDDLDLGAGSYSIYSSKKSFTSKWHQTRGSEFNNEKSPLIHKAKNSIVSADFSR